MQLVVVTTESGASIYFRVSAETIGELMVFEDYDSLERNTLAFCGVVFVKGESTLNPGESLPADVTALFDNKSAEKVTYIDRGSFPWIIAAAKHLADLSNGELLKEWVISAM